jgi:hypothetical protein
LAAPLILASTSPGEVRVAVLENGILADYALWRPGSPDGFGDVHIGRVVSRVPALAGAFVAIEGEDGFLPDSAGAHQVTEGQIIAVRITRSAQAGKGPRLAMDGRIHPGVLTGKPRLVTRGVSPLVQVAMRHRAATIEIDDHSLIPDLRAALGDERVGYVTRAFSPALDDEVAGLADQTAALPGGARVHIQPTRALTAIDIDAGGTTSQRAPKNAAQSAFNRAVLPELARQIRLRNLAGAIVVDLAGMPARRRVALAPMLAEALAADPQQPRLLGFTALGFAEISRPRARPPLHELLTTALATGLAALREAARRPTDAICLRAGPAIVAALQTDGVGLADLARQSLHRLILRSDPSLSDHHWVLEELR